MILRLTKPPCTAIILTCLSLGLLQVAANAATNKPKPAAHAASGGLGLTYDQVMHDLIDQFDMNEGSLCHGERNTYGFSKDGQLNIQVLGDHANVYRAYFSFPGGSSRVPDLTTFTLNVAPHWPNAIKWVDDSMTQAVKRPNSEITTVHGGIKYALKYYGKLLGFILAVKNPNDTAPW